MRTHRTYFEGLVQHIVETGALKTYYVIGGQVPDTGNPGNGVYVESGRFDHYPTEGEIVDYMSQVGMPEARVSKFYALTNTSEALVLSIEDGELKLGTKQVEEEVSVPELTRILEVKIYEANLRNGREPKAIFMTEAHKTLMTGRGRALHSYRNIPVYIAERLPEPMVGG